MNIKNVVFDFGQVLVHFEPEYMVGQYVKDEGDARLLCEVVFDRLYWDRLDAGTITNEQTLSECRKRLPERLWEAADTIYYNWIYNIPELDGMAELVKHLKDDHGVRLFVLSNISKYFSAHKEEIPIFKYFERLVLSAEIGIVKPSREIFEYLCTSCQIKPEDTIFIDDNKANIAGAEAYGIHTYLFDGDVNKLREHLDVALK